MRFLWRYALVIAVLMAGCVLAAACGGEEEPQALATPTGTPSPTVMATGTAGQTPTRTPEPTETVTPGALAQLAYVDTDGNLWLVNADGTGKTKLMEDCSATWLNTWVVPFASGLVWSPDGEKIACVSGGAIALVDMEGGALARVEPAEGGIFHSQDFPNFAWAPGGDAFVYVITTGHQPSPKRSLVIAEAAGQVLVRFDDTSGHFAWSPDGGEIAYHRASDDSLVVYDMSTGQETVLAEGLRPLAWLAEGAIMLVASDWGSEVTAFVSYYEANLLEVANGQLTRVLELDMAQFWVSPDRQSVAFLAGRVTLTILDVITGGMTPTGGQPRGWPTEAIPFRHVSWSEDGSSIYFAEGPNPPDEAIVLWKVNRDGSGLTKLGTFADCPIHLWRPVIFSPDGTKVACGARIANVDGSDPHVLTDADGPVAWRPVPGQ